MAERKTIADDLKEYIRRHGLTQREAAKKVGLSPSHIANLLNAREAIGFSAARKICDAFPDIDPYYLTTGEGVLCPPPGSVHVHQSQRVAQNGTGIQNVSGDAGLAQEVARLREQLAQSQAEKERLLGIIETLTKK